MDKIRTKTFDETFKEVMEREGYSMYAIEIECFYNRIKREIKKWLISFEWENLNNQQVKEWINNYFKLTYEKDARDKVELKYDDLLHPEQ